MILSDIYNLPQVKVSKRSLNAQWDTLLSISDEDIRTATFDELPKEYKTHTIGQFEEGFLSMDEIEFLEAMLSHETIDKACKAKRSSDKEKDKKKSKDLAGKNLSYKKRGRDYGDDNTEPGKYRNSSSSARKNQKVLLL